VLSSALTDQSQFNFLAGFRHETEHAVSDADFWHQKSMTDWPAFGASQPLAETGQCVITISSIFLYARSFIVINVQNISLYTC